jgi:hypothetical protein
LLLDIDLLSFLRGANSRLVAHRCGNGSGWLAPAVAIPLDQLLELREVVDYVDSSPSVQLRRLQQPQVESSEVTERHAVPEEVLLQCPLLLIKSLFLLFDVLLYQASAVVVEVLEDESLLVGVRRLPLIVVRLSIPSHQRFQLLLTLSVVMTATGRGK